ncbi:Carboxylesterase [Ancylostoma duodenale]|uniref:Carboxylesterase n=1 Tax=Ancylostoma duodenale TaxID=51022 RepID=A0A0C2E292_9BILA|nr:Carboxylesterase [Ancylostoma duodenale]
MDVPGFLSTGDKILPGNVGLWDQIWALKWVKANAEVFGGDPGNILVMGSGSGAACASILALSPRTEGLFHKILLMSGSALQPGVVRDTAINATWALNEKMQCRSFNSSELLDCFRKRMREEILDYKRLHWDDYQEFVPVVDGPGGVIPDTPEDLAKHRKKIPMMIGTTKDEMILNEKNVNFSALNTPLAEKLADNLTMGYKQFQNHRLIAEGCKAQYVWTKVDPSMSINILFDSVLKMYSHFWYDAPASRRRKDRNWQLDQRVVEIFADLIVNFARHGYPTPENSGFSFNWTATNAMELNYLSITDSPTMERKYAQDFVLLVQRA